MATIPVSFRIDPFLAECIEERCRQLGFKRPSDYYKSLGRYDLLIARPHLATGELHKLSGDQQSLFDQRLAALFKSGQTASGTWLEHTISRIAKEVDVPDRLGNPEIATIVQSLLK